MNFSTVKYVLNNVEEKYNHIQGSNLEPQSINYEEREPFLH